jgi:hypothetical protein
VAGLAAVEAAAIVGAGAAKLGALGLAVTSLAAVKAGAIVSALTPTGAARAAAERRAGAVAETIAAAIGRAPLAGIIVSGAAKGTSRTVKSLSALFEDARRRRAPLIGLVGLAGQLLARLATRTKVTAVFLRRLRAIGLAMTRLSAIVAGRTTRGTVKAARAAGTVAVRAIAKTTGTITAERTSARRTPLIGRIGLGRLRDQRENILIYSATNIDEYNGKTNLTSDSATSFGVAIVVKVATRTVLTAAETIAATKTVTATEAITARAAAGTAVGIATASAGRAIVAILGAETNVHDHAISEKAMLIKAKENPNPREPVGKIDRDESTPVNSASESFLPLAAMFDRC